MSKKVEVNSPYFMPIHAAQNNKPEVDGALILSLSIPAGVVLRSGTVFVFNLHLTYTDRYVYHIVYSQHFLIECIHLFLSSEPPIFLNFLLWLLAGAALSRCPFFSS